MIVVKAVSRPNSGQEEEMKAAALEVMEQSRTHEGLQAYFWAVDEDTGNLVLHEVHDDEASLLNHIAATDLARMSATMTIIDVELFGDTPSAELDAVLSRFGRYKHYPHVRPMESTT
jgi:quinol monooxygenase YgiN